MRSREDVEVDYINSLVKAIKVLDKPDISNRAKNRQIQTEINIVTKFYLNLFCAVANRDKPKNLKFNIWFSIQDSGRYKVNVSTLNKNTRRLMRRFISRKLLYSNNTTSVIWK